MHLMPVVRPSFARLFRRFARDGAASTAIMFGLAMPVAFGLAGIAVDYSRAVAARSRLQSVGDSVAVNAARELQVARATAESVEASAKSYVASQFSDAALTTAIDQTAGTVKVVLEKDVPMTVGKVVWGGAMRVRTSSTAKLNARLPLCLLALDTKAATTLSLEKSAQMTATGCMVYSNSTNNQGLQAKDSAVITAGLICSAGGKTKTSGAKVTPDIVTDCPQMSDPLASRTVPPVGPCTAVGKVVNGGAETLQPGVYCGGLKVTNAGRATLTRGIYVIKEGPLVVDKGGSLQGTEVGIYLQGVSSNLTFEVASSISLSAPKDGPLAGLLIFDDPTGASAMADPPYPLPELTSDLWTALKGAPREHKILSDDARLLLGTIYMPQGRLIIDATKPIADKSAYTVIVVRRIDLHDGPNLVLNSDYAATDVPVPKGVGPVGQVLLTN